MANQYSQLIPGLLSGFSLEYLRKKVAILGRTYVETTQQNIAQGGNSVRITKPASIMTPTNVSYTTPAVPQDVNINDGVTLDFTNHKEIVITANEAESRYTQGNFDRWLQMVYSAMLDGIVTSIDQSLLSLSSLVTQSVGSAASPVPLSDDLFRDAITMLTNNGLQVDPSRTTFVTNPKGYYKDLLDEQKYVNAMNVGSTDAITRGKMPNLYNVAIDYSQHITSSGDPLVTKNVLFDRFAFVIGFLEFERADAHGGAAVEEEIVTDPETGVSLRVQKYYKTDIRSWVYSLDVKWGVKELDLSRAVIINSAG